MSIAAPETGGGALGGQAVDLENLAVMRAQQAQDGKADRLC